VSSENLDQRREQRQRLAAFIAARTRRDKKPWTYLKPTDEEIEAKLDVVEDVRRLGVDRTGEALRTVREEMGRGNRETLTQMARRLGADCVDGAWYVGSVRVDDVPLFRIIADETLTDKRRIEQMELLSRRPDLFT
jgi:hypothetical protein